jgi:hypothetical protein
MYPATPAGPGVLAGSGSSEQLRAQYTAGKRVRWCEIQKKWRSSVVGERFCEAVLASPHQ